MAANILESAPDSHGATRDLELRALVLSALQRGRGPLFIHSTVQVAWNLGCTMGSGSVIGAESRLSAPRG